MVSPGVRVVQQRQRLERAEQTLQRRLEEAKTKAERDKAIQRFRKTEKSVNKIIGRTDRLTFARRQIPEEREPEPVGQIADAPVSQQGIASLSQGGTLLQSGDVRLQTGEIVTRQEFQRQASIPSERGERIEIPESTTDRTDIASVSETEMDSSMLQQRTVGLASTEVDGRPGTIVAGPEGQTTLEVSPEDAQRLTDEELLAAASQTGRRRQRAVRQLREKATARRLREEVEERDQRGREVIEERLTDPFRQSQLGEALLGTTGEFREVDIERTEFVSGVGFVETTPQGERFLVTPISTERGTPSREIVSETEVEGGVELLLEPQELERTEGRFGGVEGALERFEESPTRRRIREREEELLFTSATGRSLLPEEGTAARGVAEVLRPSSLFVEGPSRLAVSAVTQPVSTLRSVAEQPKIAFTGETFEGESVSPQIRAEAIAVVGLAASPLAIRGISRAAPSIGRAARLMPEAPPEIRTGAMIESQIRSRVRREGGVSRSVSISEADFRRISGGEELAGDIRSGLITERGGRLFVGEFTGRGTVSDQIGSLQGEAVVRPIRRIEATTVGEQPFQSLDISPVLGRRRTVQIESESVFQPPEAQQPIQSQFGVSRSQVTSRRGARQTTETSLELTRPTARRQVDEFIEETSAGLSFTLRRPESVSATGIRTRLDLSEPPTTRLRGRRMERARPEADIFQEISDLFKSADEGVSDIAADIPSPAPRQRARQRPRRRPADLSRIRQTQAVSISELEAAVPSPRIRPVVPPVSPRRIVDGRSISQGLSQGISQRLSGRTITDQDLGLTQTTSPLQGADLIQRDLSLQTFALSPLQASGQDTRHIQEVSQTQDIIQRQDLVQLQEPSRTQAPPSLIPQIKTPIRPLGGAFPFGGRRGRTRRTRPGYNTKVKTKGKFVKVNSQPLRESQADKLGRVLTDSTSSRSYRIERTDKPATDKRVTGTAPKSKFRRSKTDPMVRVEKVDFAIDSAGERKQITEQGLKELARMRITGAPPRRRGSRSRRTPDIFGGMLKI